MEPTLLRPRSTLRVDGRVTRVGVEGRLGVERVAERLDRDVVARLPRLELREGVARLPRDEERLGAARLEPLDPPR